MITLHRTRNVCLMMFLKFHFSYLTFLLVLLYVSGPIELGIFLTPHTNVFQMFVINIPYRENVIIVHQLLSLTNKYTSYLPSSMDESGKLEFRIKIPSLTVSLTKAQLMMLLKLAKSWMHENPWFFNQMLVDDVFHPKGIVLYP